MSFANLPSNHFLAQPRPDSLLPQHAGLVDTTTLAAHDFDVDNRTGFMPPQPPMKRLPLTWEVWESKLDAAVSQRLQLAERVEKMDEQRRITETGKSRAWRNSVSEMPLLLTEELKRSERALRRAHHVLSWLLHFYVQTIPSTESLLIPRSITIPLLQVSSQLQLPPVVTYSDDVLYNWAHKESHDENALPTIDNLRCQTTFTGTTDEAEFYLTSARIELRGTEALELMRLTMDEAFVGDDIAMCRITSYLERMATVIGELRQLLLSVKEGVDIEVFYHEIRPWFRGADGDPWGRPWIFEGRDEVEGWTEMQETSGASAGQSPLIQALDIYLGVDAESTQTSFISHASGKSFQERMRAYMPRHHRAFLNHLRGNQRPLRALVQKATEERCDSPILEAYNGALKALKEFRDAHMVVVALYIIGPARRAVKGVAHAAINDAMKPTPALNGVVPSERDEEAYHSVDKKETMEKTYNGYEDKEALKGTGGTDLVRFLKGVRDQTADAYLQS
ncbi:Indoleamine 2,3-dioxygenase [Macrolepiota fuliginosa MF-IS2]|uniref:Indoleamine 2,3-dioxygenase n=1 Tax=Macrolepiota fuliginosa MF-IS2 TaxID=1400762 RepID=A0A9P5XGM4_9AGAR|nr:Indoleamine 2,3-dioxygenase [Macrolepiota fuliginosa MF-IS2]